jgi:hypothetical protein
VATRPDSRDAPHLFGLGLKEMLADEITAACEPSAAQALPDALQRGHDVTRALKSEGISYGSITAHHDGSVDAPQVPAPNALG